MKIDFKKCTGILMIVGMSIPRNIGLLGKRTKSYRSMILVITILKGTWLLICSIYNFHLNIDLENFANFVSETSDLIFE